MTAQVVYGAWTALATAALQGLANDTSDVFAGWQSDRVDNIASVKAIDYHIQIIIPMAASAPANDFAATLYIVPWFFNPTGSVWTPAANFGTTTRPTGTEGTANISEPNSMRGNIPMPYKITSQPLDFWLSLLQIFGASMPDGWSLAIRNTSGAAFAGSGCEVNYKAIKFEDV
jgi:hypothetical protein